LSALEDDGEFRANLRITGQTKDMVIHTWIVDTSIEYDQAVIDGFLKISLEGLTVILRNERYLLRGLLHENEHPRMICFRKAFHQNILQKLLRRGNFGLFWMDRLNSAELINIVVNRDLPWE